MRDIPSIQLKSFIPEQIDDVYTLFRETVVHVNRLHYTTAQLDAWAPLEVDNNGWINRLNGQFTQLAWIDDILVGFASLDSTGLIDFLYIHKDYQRKGIAQLLYIRVEFEAIQLQMPRLFTEASITAKPFFEKMGFQVAFPQEKMVRGVELKNYVMEKFLN